MHYGILIACINKEELPLAEVSIDNHELNSCLNILKFLNESTDDYFFLYEIESGKIYFSGPIYKKYELLQKGEKFCTIEDWYNIVYENDLPALKEDLQKILSGKSSEHNMEYRIFNKEGRRVWISCRGKCQIQEDENGKKIILIGRISDKILLPKTDPLTGLLNVSKLYEDIEEILHEKDQWYLLIIGIDNFKHINLKYGRTYGNRILNYIAETVEKVTGTTKIYRLDGDRFAVNLKKSPDSVQKIYRKIGDNISTLCTISGGAVSYHDALTDDANAIYQFAEEALDRAKKNGKNTLSFFSIKDYERKLSDIELQEQLMNSVQNGFKGFGLFFQPQVCINTYELYGAEVLLYFESLDRGMLSPDIFIPILEQTGLICPVGMWVLEKALKQCKEWREYIPDFHISVNISYVQLAKENIAQNILELLGKSGVPGNALTLEVTESMQLQDYTRFNKIFYIWKKYGIAISVDDFGTGYSSLSYLKSIEVDELKIDRCFVSGIQHSAYNYRLIKNMLELARSSQFRVCCEGVETKEELYTLEELQPDILQGFLFSKPCSKKQFEELYVFKECDAYHVRLEKDKLLRASSVRTKQERFPAVVDNLDIIMNALDEVIYVCDPETYELYYLNPAGRRLTGVYDYKGRKCYKVIQGRIAPCELCTNKHLNLNKDLFYEWNNSYLNRRFLLKDKQIHWNGRNARLEYAIDVTDKEVLSKYVQEQELFNFHHSDILRATEVGLWVMRISQDSHVREMYTDENMRNILGIRGRISPEECYRHWYSRINDGYYHYVDLSLENMIFSEKVVQLEYTWNHPEMGEVVVRCTGIRSEDDGNTICLEGYHRIISNVNQTRFLPDTQYSERFEYNERKSVIYFHTDRQLIQGDSLREEGFPKSWVEQEIVHPHFVNLFLQVFKNVDSSEDLKETEILLKNKLGEYSWFRMKTHHLGKKAQDRNTIFVFLDQANRERRMELEHLRLKDFYKASLAETIAYAEVDLESGHLQDIGGIWTAFGPLYKESGKNFLDFFADCLKESCQVKKKKDLWLFLDNVNWNEILKHKDHTQRFCYRRNFGKEWRWVELVMHVFQDQFSKNMFALLYLKDIEMQKRREIAQTNAAIRDPLTNVYNRNAFEQKVIAYMKKHKKGILILLDIDNFKNINDCFGHLAGDSALKEVTSQLKKAFRKKDIIGRLGGDEFMVFIKDSMSRENLNEYMNRLFDKLKNNKDMPISCSAGIVFAVGKDFSYEEAVKKADKALYRSKKIGKSRHYYAEDLDKE